MTQDELKSQLHYDLETGLFTWLVKKPNSYVGAVAGYRNNQGYIVLTINAVLYYAHRLAFLYVLGKLPEEFTDHINGVRDDNRWCNLRQATKAQNSQNLKLRKTNTSGFKGVSWNSVAKKWQAAGQFNYVYYHLGLFKTPELASEAYQAFAKEKFGEFNRETRQLCLQDSSLQTPA